MHYGLLGGRPPRLAAIFVQNNLDSLRQVEDIANDFGLENWSCLRPTAVCRRLRQLAYRLNASNKGSRSAVRIPGKLQPLVAGFDFEPVTIGDSSAHVFRLRQEGNRRLFLKYGPKNGGLGEEAERLKWLSGRVRVPSLIAFVTEENLEFLLTEALIGRDGTEVGREHPEAVVVGLAEELYFWHSQSVVRCPFDHRLAVQIELARIRTENGLVDENDSRGEVGSAVPRPLSAPEGR
jgi:hypothetical protein